MSVVRRILIVGLIFCISGLSAVAAETSQISDRIGLKRGICAVIGDGAAEVALDLVRTTDCLVYVQWPGEQVAAQNRPVLVEAGVLGKRVFVAEGSPSRLHLADNVADAVVVLGDVADFDRDEAMRVVCPNGKLIVDGNATVKPFPEGVDDWPHPYHGPDNNPQSTDQLARAPYLTQFLADPRYAPVPQCCVASAGRVFKAFGNVAFKQREEAYLNTLVAFNGYNGTILWQRELVPGIMVHRNTMIATPDKLYIGNNECCQVIDAATGKLLDEIVVPQDHVTGTFWKWMAIDDGVMYAVIGQDEGLDPVMKRKEKGHGWGWGTISKGYNQPKHEWGFGRHVVAIDLKTKKVLWDYHEDEPIDCRAVCMNSRDIFLFRFGSFLTCLDAKTGNERWRRTKDNYPKLFESLGEYLTRQSWQTNWRTVAYLKCSDKALYFAGPQIGKLLAVSVADGKMMWENAYDNFQLVLRDEGLYAVSGPWGHNSSKRLDPETGVVLASYDMGRRACTRVTGSADAIFTRAMGGSQRFDVATEEKQWISPMRPPCFDGVVIANGYLYWYPFTCDCQLQLYGVTSLGPAGDFAFTPTATEAERLIRYKNSDKVTAFEHSPNDWPTYRADNGRSATTKVTLPSITKAHLLGSASMAGRPTPPVAAGGLVFVADETGLVRAIDAAKRQTAWEQHLAGPIQYPPTIWNGRAYVGAGDGCVYVLDAATGRKLWQFRAAPEQRMMPVYNKLMSTWPVGSGVTVTEDGTAYAAAGIVNIDGTYVFALDAENGMIRWQNNTSGHLGGDANSGVSVQGDILLKGDKIYMAGGTSVSPAIYDPATGKCINDSEQLKKCESNQPRGRDLYVVGDNVVTCGRPMYADPKDEIYDHTVHKQLVHLTNNKIDVAWVDSKWLAGYKPIAKKKLNDCVTQARDPSHIIKAWGEFKIDDQPIWKVDCKNSIAVVLADNAVIVADTTSVSALSSEDGEVLWTHKLTASPVHWGVAVDRDGRTIVTLVDGRVISCE